MVYLVLKKQETETSKITLENKIIIGYMKKIIIIICLVQPQAVLFCWYTAYKVEWDPIAFINKEEIKPQTDLQTFAFGCFYVLLGGVGSEISLLGLFTYTS